MRDKGVQPFLRILSRIGRLAPALQHPLRARKERRGRREAERRLRESEQQYRTTFEDAAMGIAYVDPQGRWIRVNRTLCRMLGYSQEELAGRDFREVTHPEDAARDWRMYQDLLAGRVASYEIDKRFLTRNGEVLWARVTRNRHREPGAEAAGSVAFVQDITERKQAEERLRQSERELRVQMELRALSHDAVIVRRLGGEIVSWNQGAEQIYRWKAEEVLGRRTHELLETQNAGAAARGADLDQTLAQTGRWEGELCHRRRDGTILTIDSRQVISHTPDGSPELILETNRDITARKKTGEALRESEERFRATFENAAVGIANVGTQGKWLAVNQKLCDIVGYTREELLARSFQSITHPEDLGADLAQFEKLRRGEIDTYEVEKRYIHKNGHPVWINLTVGARRDEDRRLLYCISVIQDISARKQAEQELEQAREELAQTNAELERRVAERTAELSDAMAEMEQMSYSMIHDLRAPLRAIQSFGGIIAEDPENRMSEESRDMVSKMRLAAKRMDHLICDVLNYSKVVRGQLPLEPVDVGALARGILDTYPKFRPPTAQVTIAPDLPEVVGNAAALTQCLSNLLGNAVEYAQPGRPPRIEIKGEQRENGRVRIIVEDNGIGITPESQRKVFGMFQRLTSTGQGTGMGLAIVKKAAERMGGHVGVESEPGKGSRFWIDLKAAVQPIKEHAAAFSE